MSDCLLIAYFIGNTCAKNYENPSVLSRVTAKNVGNVFLRHTVVNYFIYKVI